MPHSTGKGRILKQTLRERELAEWIDGAPDAAEPRDAVKAAALPKDTQIAALGNGRIGVK